VLVRLGQEVQEVPRRLERPSPLLADEVIRLDPVVGRYVAGFAGLTDDPDVIRFTRVPSSSDDGFAAAWVSRYTEGWENGSRAGFAIEAVTDEFLGMAGLVAIGWDMSEAEIGYIVAPAARGRGVAGRAIALISGWALGQLGLARLEAWIDVANAPSQRAIERAGFAFEGVRRSVHFKEKVRADMAIYSLLPGELG
jgi:RimJ/RimL family protein N-acetyltransferase